MSHSSTPQTACKRTPGPMASENLGNANSDTSPDAQPTMNATRSVCDKGITNPKQILNAYIYEFLVKNTMPETAKSFAAEADIPSVPYNQSNSAKQSPMILGNSDHSDKDQNGHGSSSTTPQTPLMTVAQFAEEHNVPNISLSMEAPQGFLYEWWQVFWDVFQAKNDLSSSNAAEKYYQISMMRQKQFPEVFGPDSNALGASTQMFNSFPGMAPSTLNGANPVNGSMMPNSAQLQNAMQQHNSAPLQQQMQRTAAQIDPRQQPYLMQMMKQQQSQQSHHPHPHPHPHPQQSHPSQLQPQGRQAPFQQQQIQMQQQQTPHSTPQQTHQQTPSVGQNPRPNQQTLQGMDQSMANMPMAIKQQGIYMQQQGNLQPQNRIQQQAQTQMNNLRQQAVVAQQHGQVQNQVAAQVVAAAAAAAHNQVKDPNAAGPTMNNQRVNQVRQRAGPPQNMSGVQFQFPQNLANGLSMSPQISGAGPLTNGSQVNNIQMNPGTQPMRNTNALQDYQNQLMLLEKQNKKRLDIARSNGNNDGPTPISQLQQAMQITQNQIPGPSASSPLLGNNTTQASNNTKPKKEPAKRGRKPTSSNNASTPQSAGTDLNGIAQNGRGSVGGGIKRESDNPQTPLSDVSSAKKKKKGNVESPKRQGKSTQPRKQGPRAKKGEEAKFDLDTSEPVDATYENFRMRPTNGTYYSSSSGGDKMNSVDMLGGGTAGLGNSDPGFFNGGNASIDDIDFDFNSILSGGDEGLGDGLQGFNWGNPIEGD